MFNSRLFCTFLLITTIILIFIMGVFFLKKERTTILNTNYGTVDLGKVYGEKVFINVEIQGFLSDEDKYESLGFVPIYNSMSDINKIMEKSFSILNSYENSETKIPYEKAKPKVDMKLRLTTTIQYLSSNYTNEAFVFIVGENEYILKKQENLKNSIEKAINLNLISVQRDVSESLFLTKPENLGIKLTKNE